MHLFWSEESVDVWCERQQEPRGTVFSLEDTWRLAQLWYENRLDETYRGRSQDEAVAIFEVLGFTTAFWAF